MLEFLKARSCGCLGTKSAIAKFMGLKKIEEVTAETYQKVADLLAAVADGTFDADLMAWGCLEGDTPAENITTQIATNMMEAGMATLLGNST